MNHHQRTCWCVIYRGLFLHDIYSIFDEVVLLCLLISFCVMLCSVGSLFRGFLGKMCWNVAQLNLFIQHGLFFMAQFCQPVISVILIFYNIKKARPPALFRSISVLGIPWSNSRLRWSDLITNNWANKSDVFMGFEHVWVCFVFLQIPTTITQRVMD